MTIRVNILADSIVSGDAVGRHTVDLARALVAGGNQVHIYHQNQFTRSEKDILKISTRVRLLDTAPKADVTILQYAGWFPFAEQFKTVTGARIFWYHGVTPPDLWGTQLNKDLLIRSQYGARLVHASSLAVADSPFGGKELAKLAAFPINRIQTIPIGIDQDEFRKKPADVQLASLSRQLHIQDHRVLMYVGRVAGNKRVDLLVSALDLLRDQFPDLVLLVVGDTNSNPAYREYTSSVRQLAQSLKLSERVILTGKVPSVSEYYHLANVFVLASQHEGFGVPLVEAMAAGVPVVASNSTAIPWVLGYDEDEKTQAGLLFTPGAAENLAECIRLVLDSKDLANSLREKGCNRSLSFTPDRFRQSVLHLLEQVAEIHAAGTAYHIETDDPLTDMADVALRDYRISSRIPVFGKLIEWLRFNMTVHVKEAYLDRIIERQVIYNIVIMDKLKQLQSELDQLKNNLTEKPTDETPRDEDDAGKPKS